MLLRYKNYFFTVSEAATHFLGKIDTYSFLKKGTVSSVAIIPYNQDCFSINRSEDVMIITENDISVPFVKKKPELNARILEVALFLFAQKQNLKHNIVSLHASAVGFDKKLFIFLGPKQSGKSTMMYLLSKYENFEVLGNDYVELLVSENEVNINFTDNNEEMSFRKETLYKINGDQRGQKSIVSEEMISMQNKRITFKNKTFSKIYFVFPNLGKSGQFEVSRTTDIYGKIYKEMVYFLKNADVLCIQNDRLLPVYIEDNALFCEENHQQIIDVLEMLSLDNRSSILELYGESHDFINFITTECEEVNGHG